jgi:hypothetical protein
MREMPKRAPYPYWIKERDNPQLGTYYVAMVQMSKTQAMKHESPLYGSNTMLQFSTEEIYKAKLSELTKAGQRVH